MNGVLHTEKPYDWGFAHGKRLRNEIFPSFLA